MTLPSTVDRPPLPRGFYDRPVVEVARALLGCVLRHGDAGGAIVETEAYHQSEPACHAFAGLTPRTRPLFGPPGRAYVYRSYGIHACLNAVCEREGVGAAVLVRALEPLEGLDAMRERRGLERVEDLCSGPGKLTQALGIGLDLDGVDLVGGPITVEPAPPPEPEAPVEPAPTEAPPAPEPTVVPTEPAPAPTAVPVPEDAGAVVPQD